jgi:predicted ABC-type transport system involved in lysophospholipase L1 biosynthesis ATPase subunit
VLGERQRTAAAELAQWWEAVRAGGAGSQAVLLVAPAGWGRSTLLNQLPGLLTGTEDGAGLVVRLCGESLPEAPGLQAAALRDGLLGP